MISTIEQAQVGRVTPCAPQSENLGVALHFGHACGSVQPIANVPKYLATRDPQPDFRGEEQLLITLPAKVQSETKAMVRACLCVAALVKARMSVQSACREALRIYAKWNWKLATFRQLYDRWYNTKDWVVLVNKAKAPAAWRAFRHGTGLPEAFLVLCEQRFGKFAREDGKRQALLSIQRQWKTGRNEQGVEEPIAGYEHIWATRDRENPPAGWSYSNILRQLAKRARFTKGVRALLHDSESAARQHLPQVLGSRKSLRFLEKVAFDDVRMDWLVFNTETGEAEELWLLVARDEATAMVLGFVMQPATVREDGKCTHLGAQQMKELAAWILERYPLPPYPVHWVVERGTATLAEGVKAALGELFNQRIKVHYTSMIGDVSPVGYREKSKGNSRGKASHESHNRLFHTQASYLPGQTGSHYGIRPADLDSRVRECKEIWQLRQRLPEHMRGNELYPMVVLQTQAREVISQFCVEQNFRTDHKLEGFEEVLEWWDAAACRWRPNSELPSPNASVRFKKRMEMPVERAMRLINSVKGWERVSPDIIVSFLSHTQRRVTVETNGEIKFDHRGKTLIFRSPSPISDLPSPLSHLAPGTKCLAYHNPDQPEFIHLTSGDGRILGTWAQRGRGSYQDQQALAEAMRYTHRARQAAKDVADELAAPQREQLDAMRAHNNELARFITVTDAPAATGLVEDTTVSGALRAVRQIASQEKSRQAEEDRFVRREGRAAAEDILADTNADPETFANAGDALLDALE